MKRIVTVSLLSLLFLAYVPQDASAQTRIRFALRVGFVDDIWQCTAKVYPGCEGRPVPVSDGKLAQRCVVLGNQATSSSYSTDAGDNWIDLFNNCGSTTSFTLTVSIR